MKVLRTITLATLGLFAAMCAPLGATTLNYNQPTSGSVSPVGQSVPYTLAVNAKDVLNFNIVATLSTSGSFGPCLALYDPDGNDVSSAGGYGSTAFPMTYQALLTGTYTLVVSDCANQATGNFILFVQKSNAPMDPVSLSYAVPTTGVISSAAQAVAYTFTANAKDILDLNVVATSSKSGTLGPCVHLYNSTGTPILDSAGGYGSQAFAMGPYVVPAAGAFNLFIEDCSLTATGNYTLFVQKSNAPVNAQPIVYGETQAGTLSSAAQSVAYTMQGYEGDVLNFAIAVTASSNGTTLGPCLALYNTTSAQPVETAGGYGSQNFTMNNYKVPATGTYNLIVNDCSLTATGTYNLTSQCLIGTCPLPKPSIASISPDSAPVGSKAVTLTINGAGFAHINASTVVQWTGPGQSTANINPTFVSTNQLTAVIPGTDFQAAGTATVDVETPAPGGGASNDVTFTINGAAPTPTCSPTPGTYANPINVTLADTATKAVIYYTTNGTTPTTASAVYSAAIPVTLATSPEIIEAIAVAPGFTTSATASCVYTIEPAAAPPTFSPAVGAYTNGIAVTISDATPGVAIYYTTNNATPTTSSARYTAPINLTGTTTVKAIAVLTGYAASPVASAVFTIIGSPSALSVPATSITTTGATLNAVVNTHGLAGSYSYVYGTSSTALTSSTAATALTATSNAVNAPAKLTTLTTKTTYYYQIVVKTAGGLASGSILTFTTN